MTVSFCVIGYNEEHTIESLLADICNQDYPHEKMEVVLVNALSTDRTRLLMETFAKRENGFIRIAVIDNPKRRQAAGWNCAIKESKGDIILRVDAHSSVPPDFVSKSVKKIENGEYVVGGPRPSISETNTPWQNTLLLSEKSMFGSGIAMYRRSFHKKYVKSVFHGAYRREVFEHVGMFNENLGRTEDNEMHYRIRKSGYKICYDPGIISYQHTRNTWNGIIKQKFGNGYWIGLTVGICPRCFSFYHFVPLVFILSILIGTLLSLCGYNLALLIIAFTYVIVDLIMSLISSMGVKKHWQYLLLPIIFLSLHAAYGFGTLNGLIRMPFWVHKTKLKDNATEEKDRY